MSAVTTAAPGRAGSELNWHKMPVEEVYRQLDVDPDQGLSGERCQSAVPFMVQTGWLKKSRSPGGERFSGSTRT